MFGTFIEKIKKGSLCDSVYHLKPGDELVEWNRIKLRNLTINQVTDIMLKSRVETEVEIIVERCLSSNTYQANGIYTLTLCLFNRNCQ